MTPFALLRIAFKALLRNRMRTFLSVLGIVIGVAAVITMVAIGEGSKLSIKEQIGSLGANVVMIFPNNRSVSGVRMDGASVQLLTISDVHALKKRAENLASASPVVSARGQVVAAGGNWPGTITGVWPEYLQIRGYELEDGIMFEGEENMSKVCVIGKTVADNLFPGTSPVGQTIRYRNIPFKVIGLLKSKGTAGFGQDQDDVILAPFSAVQRRVLATTNVQSIYAAALNEQSAPLAVEEAKIILSEEKKLPPDNESFRIQTQQEILDMVSSTANLLTTVLTAIAGISLLVGGIGIMNIMYVSVTERTREIGLRMAIGARGLDILMQFLFEAVLISLTGGFIGILFGACASYIVKFFANWPVSISVSSIAVSFSVCFATGVFFGWYPARKAARLDPIEALRYE
ncbi:MAG: ABC transporter permease [Fibromonadaceae bacterium]|jgi:putative ABC transport system permease protein|nr:ABC transporter permease [Fibromonadaceae bacterium]